MFSVAGESDFQVSSGIYAVKFGATWCAPCKKLEPTLAQLESEFSKIGFMSVDVEQVPTLAQKYKIRSVPTLVFLKDGQEVNRVSGLSLIEPLRKILRDLTKEEV